MRTRNAKKIDNRKLFQFGLNLQCQWPPLYVRHCTMDDIFNMSAPIGGHGPAKSKQKGPSIGLNRFEM
jgi:hypothetical protein